jgi:hypothetical protein
LSPPTTQIALGILFLIFLPLTLPMLNIDETTGKRLIDFSLAPNVDFQALNGDVFYKELKIKHYPFLLNKGFIHQ